MTQQMTQEITPPDTTNNTRLAVRRWVANREGPFDEPVFMTCEWAPPRDLRGASVVLPDGGLARAMAVRASGAERVFLADAVLEDSLLMKWMAEEVGGKYMGVWVPVRRMEVDWSLDNDNDFNADFRCVVPSYAKPAWEVLKSDMTPTGTEAGWWIEQMLSLGASAVLISADLADGRDLDVCAELAERFGEQLWFSPLTPGQDMKPWVQWGLARQLVIPEEDYRDEMILALNAASASSEGANG